MSVRESERLDISRLRKNFPIRELHIGVEALEAPGPTVRSRQMTRKTRASVRHKASLADIVYGENSVT